VRIAALSDQHGYLPDIPSCDLLIVAGDVCIDRIDGQWAEVFPEKQALWFSDHVSPWLQKVDAPQVVTWGNHDWCGQVRAWWPDDPRIVVDRVVTVAGLNVWASPWSLPFGDWAFMKDERELAPIYDAIPMDTDIIVSHGPPYGIGDTNAAGQHCGSRELLIAIKRVHPRLVVCGHIHEGAGIYDCQGIRIVNASVVNERYQLVRPPTIFELNGVTS
jgi:Icc-related predicted phosphoesterase